MSKSRFRAASGKCGVAPGFRGSPVAWRAVNLPTMLMDILTVFNALKTYSYYALGVLLPVLNVVFAGAVFLDSRRLVARGQKLVLFGGPVWAAGTLLLGLPALALYWAAHHSSLRGGEPATR